MTPQLSPKTVAFQGVPGAYSNLACREVFPDADAMACLTFQAAFEAVRSGKADVGMIPIENTLGGRVAGIHSLLPDSGLFIVGEHFQKVEHMLLAPKGATLEGLKRIYSHEQALAQCKVLIENLGLEAIAHADTAGAAQEIAERGDVEEAAVASSLAAETYDLEILRSRIEDKIGNTTRFVIMARQRMDPPPSEKSIMSLMFNVRSVPGSLYKALGGFATNGVNVVKLESYITDMSFTKAQFYAEIEGHPGTLAVDRALDEVRFFSTNVKELGVYPAHPFRSAN
ncbi:prephenate dehydratase [Minwuia sp.]|uniref:prephenate dehydratase n=1 Tax=Minwuia sp. TaxID=2493630 RepID=UPI003A9255CE